MGNAFLACPANPAERGAYSGTGNLAQRSSASSGALSFGRSTAAEIALEAQLVDDTVAVVGSTEVVFADCDVSVLQVPVVLSAEDHGTAELQLYFTRSP